MSRRALVLLALLVAGDARGAELAGEVSACASGGPAIRVNVLGLKDRSGGLKLELYPANESDFLRDDRDLVRQGKFFHRIRVATPQGGAVALCIRAPRAGRYALLLTHDRDGRNKFNFWADGAGFPSNTTLGRSKPTLTQALIAVPHGVATIAIRVQYLRGLGGFAPLPDGA